MKRFLSLILIVIFVCMLFGCTKNTQKQDEPITQNEQSPDTEQQEIKETIKGTARVLGKSEHYLIVRYKNDPMKIICDNWDSFEVNDYVSFCGDMVALEKPVFYIYNGGNARIEFEIINANVSRYYIEDEEGAILGAKPVIYLYPEKSTDVSVSVDLEGSFTCVYPDYDSCWQVTASPDGTLKDSRGREYYCLYWEGAFDMPFNNPKDVGFVVKGCDTAEFLRKKVLALGLN